MKVYKLTDKAGQTRRGTQWGHGITHTAEGELRLCNNGLHAYSDPLLAVLLNPIHAAIVDPRLWECDGSDQRLDDCGLKTCHRSLTTVKEIPLPEVTTAQRVRFAIYCAREVVGDSCPKWSQWAERWLTGEDRGPGAARAARDAAVAAADAAAEPINLIALARKAIEDEANIEEPPR